MAMATTTTTTREGPNSPPSPGPNGNNNNSSSSSSMDTFMGTNVYLYGFLSTLILIFLVSVAVAYKGYRTRALLRRRIDEALAAGVLIPGLTPDDGYGGRHRRDPGVKPVMSDVWLTQRPRQWATNITKWDQLQPLSLQSPCRPSPNEPSAPPTLEEWAAQHPFHRSLFSRNRTRLGQPNSTSTPPQPQPQSPLPPQPLPPNINDPPRSVGNSVVSIPVPSDGIRQPPTPNLPLQSPAGSSLVSVQTNSDQQQQQQQQQVVEVPLLLSVVIAMPDLSRAKGKERETNYSPHGYSYRPHPSENENENENGQLLPELVLGYSNVPLVVRRPLLGPSTVSVSALPVPPTLSLHSKQSLPVLASSPPLRS